MFIARASHLLSLIASFPDAQKYSHFGLLGLAALRALDFTLRDAAKQKNDELPLRASLVTRVSALAGA